MLSRFSSSKYNLKKSFQQIALLSSSRVHLFASFLNTTHSWYILTCTICNSLYIWNNGPLIMPSFLCTIRLFSTKKNHLRALKQRFFHFRLFVWPSSSAYPPYYHCVCQRYIWDDPLFIICQVYIAVLTALYNYKYKKRYKQTPDWLLKHKHANLTNLGLKLKHCTLLIFSVISKPLSSSEVNYNKITK